MTFSLLARDPNSSSIGGAAATGSLCVGGWVLRGRLGAGLSASQGASPSTLWGEQALDAMAQGEPAAQALQRIASSDSGSTHRQIAALPVGGEGACYTGESNSPYTAHCSFEEGIASGNMLSSPSVIEAMVEGYKHNLTAGFAHALLQSLFCANAAGGDSRGLQSAAILVLSPDAPPLSLRVDYSETPLQDLQALHEKATTGDYFNWTLQVPTVQLPERKLD